MVRVRWRGSGVVPVAVLILSLGGIVDCPVASAGDGAGEPATARRAGDLARDAHEAFDRFLKGGDPAGWSDATQQPVSREPQVSQTWPPPDEGALGWLNRGYRAFQDEVVGKLATPILDASATATAGKQEGAAQGRPVPDNATTTEVPPPSETSVDEMHKSVEPEPSPPLTGKETGPSVVDMPQVADQAGLEETRRRDEIRRTEMIRQAEAQRRAAERRETEAKAAEALRKAEAERIVREATDAGRIESSQQVAGDRTLQSPLATAKPPDRATPDTPATEIATIKTLDEPGRQASEKEMSPTVAKGGPEAMPDRGAVPQAGAPRELQGREAGRAHEKKRRPQTSRAEEGNRRSPAERISARSKATSWAPNPAAPIARPLARSMAPRPIGRPSL